MIGGEGTIKDLQQRMTELEHERDELAAHVERLHRALDNILNEIGTHSRDDLSDDEKTALEVLAETPATSLARRDLLKQAEALEEIADDANPNCEAQDAIVSQAYEAADKLRQQANQP